VGEPKGVVNADQLRPYNYPPEWSDEPEITTASPGRDSDRDVSAELTLNDTHTNVVVSTVLDQLSDEIKLAAEANFMPRRQIRRPRRFSD
jgi:hypothetical protein